LYKSLKGLLPCIVGISGNPGRLGWASTGNANLAIDDSIQQRDVKKVRIFIGFTAE
jgi:hypothetical protein